MRLILAVSIIISVAISAITLDAQTAPAPCKNAKSQSAFEFHLARSLTDKNAIDKPASLQITIPDGKDRTYAADLATGLTYIPALVPCARVQTEYGTSAEYHRNTVADKPQNSLIIAVSMAQQRGNLATPGTNTVWFPSYAAKYKKDRIKGTESAIPSVDLRVASRALGAGFLLGSESLGFLWEPKLGAEYERTLKAAANGPTGGVGRAFGSVEIGIYPLVTRLSERLVVVGSFKQWQDFARSASLDAGRKTHQLRKYSLNYFLDEQKHFAIGADRVQGENPSEGQPEQRYTQLAFKVSF